MMQQAFQTHAVVASYALITHRPRSLSLHSITRADMPVVSEEEEEGQGTSVDRAQDPPRACPYAAAAKIQNGSKGQLWARR